MQKKRNLGQGRKRLGVLAKGDRKKKNKRNVQGWGSMEKFANWRSQGKRTLWGVVTAGGGETSDFGGVRD